ncbi:hypothetical protein CARUB_v10017614mg [Capsella rubella]|uniref:Uncharacterized protein n=1 Tax=Capsella rubella TaxID=81985 RepID=R0HKI6_9BRAS|nr:hypothetical protein CARUB_v10017614mg [Capsella rubella]
MERVSWQLKPPPTVGWYRLRRYTLPSDAYSLYWLYYEWTKGKKTTGNTASVSIPQTQNKGPPNPGGGGPFGASTSAYMSLKASYGASTSGSCNKTVMSDKGTEAQLRGFMPLSLNHSVPSSLLILSRALIASGRINAVDAVRATLSSIAWDTVGITSLPSEDSVSELRRKLWYLGTQDESIMGDEEDLARINKSVISGEEDKLLQEMTTLTASKAQEHARTRILDQQDDLCKLSCALALLASTSSERREQGELLRLLRKEVEFYYTMVEKAAEADEVSYALMEKVDGLLQNFEKELFGVDVNIGKGCQHLDRYLFSNILFGGLKLEFLKL